MEELVSDGVVRLEHKGNTRTTQVWVLGSVRCTNHQIHKAKLHALNFYPGCTVAPTVNPHIGISKERAGFVERFLRCDTVVETVETSLANAAKGVRYRLKQRRWVLWHRLVREMSEAKLRPVSWGHFWMLTSTKQYELLTVDNCCCGACREMGFDNYDEMDSILESLNQSLLRETNDAAGLTAKNTLKRRITKEREFRSGLFARHLEAESSVGTHCLKQLLTSHNDSRFCKPCTHTCTGGSVMPITWEQMIWNDEGR